MRPCGIRQRSLTDRDRGTGHGPRSQPRGYSRRNGGRRERKAEPQPREPEKFAERSQHHDVAAVHLAGKARAGRSDLHEGLVHHEEPAMRSQLGGNCEQRRRRHNASIRIVRVDNNGKVCARKVIELADLFRVVSGESSDADMLRIGRPQHRGASAR